MDDRRIFSFVHDYRRLIVWQRARTLGVDIHVASRSFPRSDRGLVAGQLRRSALSISANIAEGCGKTSRRETIRFLEIASGSANETEHHLLVAGDLGFLAPKARDELASTTITVQRMLRSLILNLPQ
ncbi:four helix bundle protein [soil metagenome]